MEKYLVCPGNIGSRSDGDEHYVSAPRLMELYNVDPNQCIVVDRPEKALGLDWSKYIVLRPRYDGDYRIHLIP